MPPFHPEVFARDLIAEALFYEENFGLVGAISLIDPAAGSERFIASFDLDEGAFIIEEATEWEADEEVELSYLLAVDGEVYETYDSSEAAAAALLTLAKEHMLTPRLHVLYEDRG